MPRAIHRVAKNFTVIPFKDKIIFSHHDEMSNRQICVVDANKHQVISGPGTERSQNVVVNATTVTAGMLKPTLLEPTVFYRIVYDFSDEGDSTMLELYEFVDSEFVLLKSMFLDYYFEAPYIRLLDRRFLLFRRVSRSKDVSLQIYELFEENYGLVSTTHLDHFAIDYIVQDGIVFVLLYSGGDYDQIMKFSFDDGIPYVIEVDALKDVQVYCLDRTPGNSHIIIEQGVELFTFVVEDDTLRITPLGYDIPHRQFLEVVNVKGVLVPLYDDLCPDVICTRWSFVELNGELHCTEYNSVSGCSSFFQIFKKFFNCLFVLDDLFKYYCSNMSRVNFIQEYPIIFDFFNHSISIWNPSSKDFENCILYSVSRYYDLETGQWTMRHVTRCNTIVYLFINGTEVRSIESDESSEISVHFNHHHHLLCYCRERKYFVNNHYMSELNHASLFGNNVWGIDGFGGLVVHKLCHETGEVISSKQLYFEYEYESKIHNPYFPEECIYIGEEKSFFVRYNEQDGDFKVLEVEYDIEPDAIFVDKGLLVCHKKILQFDNDGVIYVEISPMGKTLYTPKQGVAIGETFVEDLQVKLDILTFKDNCNYDIETKNMDIAEFLNGCSISSMFTSFSGYDPIDKC
ncbi:hypothetical protein PCE1_002702 [Barthelona sp. PCE]